ncbi:ESX secretion-associated protein EspG [Nocardia sp. NPDC006630]|uniref:ESX secretion-associated protein EspG n=1 Tax=Nocardia sp. NPDC006630 TaxID=3157181 RepID=UPI0033A3774F
MSAKLQFDDLEFVVLWEKSTGERLPGPFGFKSRTPMYYDYLSEKNAVAEKLKSKWNRSLDVLAEMLVEPDIRITVSGYDGRDPQNAGGRVRLMALRKRERGYIIVQSPGETYMNGAGFTATECDPVLLAEAVVAALPEAEAGSQPDTALAVLDEASSPDEEFVRTTISDIFDNSDSLRAKKFLAAPIQCFGAIDVVQGRSKFGPRGVAARRLEWRDLEGDGRYVIGGEPPHVATAADPKRLIAAINIRVAAIVRAIKDERGD